MKFTYSTSAPFQSSGDSLPRVELVLEANGRIVSDTGLVDSGATISILPHAVGLKLGFVWDESKARVPLSGSLGAFEGIPVLAKGTIGSYKPVDLVFAWVNSNELPMILGQTNFFTEFEIHFYRARFEFEVYPRSP